MSQEPGRTGWGRRAMVSVAAAAAGLAGAVVVVPPGPAGAQPLTLGVVPAAGPWFTTVSVTGSGCTAAAGTDLIVTGAMHRLGAEPFQLGRLAAVPAADGSWSAAIVVTHVGGNPQTGEGGPVSPGDYEIRATCGRVTSSQLGSPVPADPPIATYTGAFEVQPGGPTPTVRATPTTVTVGAGTPAVVAVSGDRCVRPDGPSSGYVRLDPPPGSDDTDPTLVHAENGFFTPSADGHWSTEATLVTGGPGIAAKPGAYRLTATCWLGTRGNESLNGWEYEVLTITVLAGTPPVPTPPSPPPTPAPAGPVRATPVYTG